MTVVLLDDTLRFPPPRIADPDGLLAIGGDLSPERLLEAYRKGIFPWYVQGQPILWWSPDPRLILFPQKFHLSRSLRRSLRTRRFMVSMDGCFERVIHLCGAVRSKHREDTWITPEMETAYGLLHRMGVAHSVEVWSGDRLVGGLYGVSLGKAFFGESMFSLENDASKTALAALVSFVLYHGFHWIDCQVTTDHLLRMGAEEIPRNRFLGLLRNTIGEPGIVGRWELPEGWLDPFIGSPPWPSAS